MRLNYVESIVRKILTDFPRTRDDDDELYVKVCETLNPNITYMTFSYVMRSRSSFGLPIFESVRRTRQKLQEENEYLRGTLSTQEKREKHRQEYLEYARS